MMLKIRIRNDRNAMGRATLALVIVGLLLVTGLAYAGYSFWKDDPSKEPRIKVVEEGDGVECDYIGQFTDGRVFDTSLIDVAHDNVTYPKSLQFQLRKDYAYTPYRFIVGEGTTIEGWQEAVIGMTIGQTKVVRIEPDKGYGEKDPSKITVANLTVKVPIFVTMDLAVFKEQFPDVAPTVGGSFLNPTWHWYCEVHSVDEDSGIIVYRNLPEENAVYPLHEDANWNIKVTDVDQSGGANSMITVRHLLTGEDANSIMVTESDGDQFIVTDVDEDAGTYTMDYNREVVGRTLIFKITITDIEKAEDWE